MKTLTFKQKIDILDEVITSVRKHERLLLPVTICSQVYLTLKRRKLRMRIDLYVIDFMKEVFPELAHALVESSNDPDIFEEYNMMNRLNYGKSVFLWDPYKYNVRVEFLTNVKLMLIDAQKEGII